ncbi:MAG: peptidyl-alpha-hydroxyglycine alpha-amidating lyase family protein [Chloroflexi bacterium]|nr:peptidyl-alpha-hydroxyglycine alpha-amidating lyase family protein [Chloroflexota bacterium]
MVPSPVTKDTVFEPVPGWAKIPHGFWLREATAVTVGPDDRVYVFNRGNMPILVFDPNGNVVDHWGNDNPPEDVVVRRDSYGNALQFWNTWFKRTHAISTDHEGNLWLVDDVGCQIHKMSVTGEFLLTIGTGEQAPRESGKPFNRPTDVVVSKKTGEVFISDGYGNSRIHRYSPEGEFISSFGESGTAPGQFSLPHNLALLDDEEIVVCDRENYRVQVFSLDGEFHREWRAHKAVAVEVVGSGADARIYVAEQGPPPVQQGVARLGNRMDVFNRDGALITHFGAEHYGQEPNQFLWPHSVAVDSHGDVYVAEVSFVEWGRHQNPVVDNPASLRKWRRVRG